MTTCTMRSPKSTPKAKGKGKGKAKATPTPPKTPGRGKTEQIKGVNELVTRRCKQIRQELSLSGAPRNSYGMFNGATHQLLPGDGGFEDIGRYYTMTNSKPNPNGDRIPIHILNTDHVLKSCWAIRAMLNKVSTVRADEDSASSTPARSSPTPAQRLAQRTTVKASTAPKRSRSDESSDDEEVAPVTKKTRLGRARLEVIDISDDDEDPEEKSVAGPSSEREWGNDEWEVFFDGVPVADVTKSVPQRWVTLLVWAAVSRPPVAVVVAVKEDGGIHLAEPANRRRMGCAGLFNHGVYRAYDVERDRWVACAWEVAFPLSADRNLFAVKIDGVDIEEAGCNWDLYQALFTKDADDEKYLNSKTSGSNNFDAEPAGELPPLLPDRQYPQTHVINGIVDAIVLCLQVKTIAPSITYPVTTTMPSTTASPPASPDGQDKTTPPSTTTNPPQPEASKQAPAPKQPAPPEKSAVQKTVLTDFSLEVLEKYGTDIWDRDSWSFNMVPESQRVKPSAHRKTHLVSSEELTLLQRFKPTLRDLVAEYADDTKKERDRKLREWKNAAADAILAHPIWLRKVKEGTSDFGDWKTWMVKEFANEKDQRIGKAAKTDKKAGKKPALQKLETDEFDAKKLLSQSDSSTKLTYSTDSLTDAGVRVLRQFLKFPFLLEGKQIFEEEHRDAVQVRMKELLACDAVKSDNVGAAERKAAGQLWGELSDDERKGYGERARKDFKTTELITSSLPFVINELMKFLGGLLPAMSMACIVGLHTKEGGTKTNIVDINTIDEHPSIASLLPADIHAQIEEWLLLHKPDDCRQLNFSFESHSKGVPAFPSGDLSKNGHAQLQVLLEEYLLVTWQYAHKDFKKVPRLSYEQLAQEGERFYDTKKWEKLLPIFKGPSNLTWMECVCLIAFLQDSSTTACAEPFEFFPVPISVQPPAPPAKSPTPAPPPAKSPTPAPPPAKSPTPAPPPPKSPTPPSPPPKSPAPAAPEKGRKSSRTRRSPLPPTRPTETTTRPTLLNVENQVEGEDEETLINNQLAQLEAMMDEDEDEDEDPDHSGDKIMEDDLEQAQDDDEERDEDEEGDEEEGDEEEGDEDEEQDEEERDEEPEPKQKEQPRRRKGRPPPVARSPVKTRTSTKGRGAAPSVPTRASTRQKKKVEEKQVVESRPNKRKAVEEPKVQGAASVPKKRLRRRR
ncbi:hypothetical protein BDZ89DRAFT_1042075 [Hymenopellis radicata]|nr:hypothetical protein BDZ89DRAFT_1042075 [Hymenopellis radicata]